MKYEKARNLVFNYFLKDKELNKVNNDIMMYERNMPYDNGFASEFTMKEMEKDINKKQDIEEKMKILKDEIELLLRIFK